MFMTMAGVDGGPRGVDMLVETSDHEEAEAQLRALRDCVEMISHEIRSPLGAVMFNADRIERTTRETSTAEIAHKIKRSVERISEIVTRILDSAQIDSVGLALRLEEADLVVVVLESVDRLRDEAQKAGCVITVDCPAPVISMWDRGRIDQIVTNLLTNAIKYGAGKPVHVRVTTENEWACVEVRDGGCGIPPALRDHVFDRYTRLDKRDRGFGLGLWIVKQIVDAFQGEVCILDDDPPGTRFRVRLPLSTQ
jgi:signal transduction histidine kinase